MTTIIPELYDAVVFDMDGVVTDTASAHAAAWKVVFDAFLERRGGGLSPFTEDDYLRYVDGKTRYDGVASFLASRGIELPWGDPSDAPGDDTVCAVGNIKNDVFRRWIVEHGVVAYPSTLRLIDELRRAGLGVAVISGSRNAEEVLGAAGVTDKFDTRVDGAVAAQLGLPGKPDPAVFLEAARRLGSPVERTVVVEDAIAGVAAGRGGGFGLVIGVDRVGHAAQLRDAGADVVVTDLSEVDVEHATPETTPIADVAPAQPAAVAQRLTGRRPVVFLDYDGTLTPIVERPEDATIGDDVRDVLRRLASVCTVGVISGRDLNDVRAMVDVGGLYYAGSHGFDIVAPDGSTTQHGVEFLPSLDAAEERLRSDLAGISGARVERKRFAIAVHFRQVPADRRGDVEVVVRAVSRDVGKLRITGGKMIFELRPDLDWDKGRALLSLLDALGLGDADVVPVYVGDDVTDEDAFRALRGRGLSLVVRGEDDARPTYADFTLDDPAAAVRLLDDLAGQLAGGQ